MWKDHRAQALVRVVGHLLFICKQNNVRSKLRTEKGGLPVVVLGPDTFFDIAFEGVASKATPTPLQRPL
jgi:hypothetical protein